MSENFPKDPIETGRLGKPGIVAHDAGGAQHLLAWLPNLPVTPIVMFEGPAARLATFAGVGLHRLSSANLSKCDWLLVGTGWQSQMERAAMRFGYLNGITVAAVLDHWVNYSERFDGLAANERPSILISTDEQAHLLSMKTFPGKTSILWKNSLVDKLRTELSELKANTATGDPHVLLLSEPVERATEDVTGQPEEKLISGLPAILDAIGWTQGEPRVILRLHPTEAYAKYQSAIVQSRLPISVKSGDAHPLSADLFGASHVVGLSSYSLFLASQLGYKTYSICRSLGLEFNLPSSAAESLQVEV